MKSKKNPHTFKCINCPQKFFRQEAVCFTCASCQNCGLRTPNKYGNECIHCKYYLPIPSYKTLGPTHNVHIHHHN